MTAEQQIDPHNLVSDQLQPGETLLWVGKPTPYRVALQHSRYAREAGIWMLIFLGFLLVFPDFRRAVAPIGDFLSLIIPLYAVVMLAFLIYPIREYLIARQTVYAITDRRVLIVKRRLRGNLEVVSFDQPLHLKRHDRRDAKGDLVFTNVYWEQKNGIRTDRFYAGLYGIDNTAEAERLILEALPGSTSTTNGKGL